MLRLEPGSLLYHGSFTQVPVVDLTKCASNKDFGQGFYVTSSLEQARGFVPLSVRKKERGSVPPKELRRGWVSIYAYRPTGKETVHLFESANRSWLRYVAANRRASLFPELIKEYAAYDIIGGKIANDRTAQTLQFYMAGAYGTPGSPEADAMAIRLLLPNRLTDQFCFKTPCSVECLEYVGCEPYDFS